MYFQNISCPVYKIFGEGELLDVHKLIGIMKYFVCVIFMLVGVYFQSNWYYYFNHVPNIEGNMLNIRRFETKPGTRDILKPNLLDKLHIAPKSIGRHDFYQLECF